jgi:hypothetical protein
MRSIIWVMEPDWIRVRDLLDLDAKVTVRVKAIRNTHRFRFPLELECVQPVLEHLLHAAPPEDPPIIIYEDEDINAAAVRAWGHGAP